jgi:hypothetical protein
MSDNFRYGPNTQHIQNQMNTNMFNNFNQAYEPNKTLIDITDYTNKKHVLHNNLDDNLLNERIVEYSITIDSSDRDITKFPSPFYFQTSFGNINNSPYIDKNMANVKYVTLNYITIPRTIAIDTSEINLNNNEFKITPTSSLITAIPPGSYNHTNKDPSWLLDNLNSRPYLIVKIDGLKDEHTFGSSPKFGKNTIQIKADQRTGDMYIYKPKSNNTIVFANSSLKNINLLTLNLIDEKGKDINIIDHNGKKIIGQNISNDVPYDYNAYIQKYNHDKFVEYTNCNTQVIYNFTFGIIENELNTKTNYNKN